MYFLTATDLLILWRHVSTWSKQHLRGTQQPHPRQRPTPPRASTHSVHLHYVHDRTQAYMSCCFGFELTNQRAVTALPFIASCLSASAASLPRLPYDSSSSIDTAVRHMGLMSVLLAFYFLTPTSRQQTSLPREAERLPGPESEGREARTSFRIPEHTCTPSAQSGWMADLGQTPHLHPSVVPAAPAVDPLISLSLPASEPCSLTVCDHPICALWIAVR